MDERTIERREGYIAIQHIYCGWEGVWKEGWNDVSDGLKWK